MRPLWEFSAAAQEWFLPGNGAISRFSKGHHCWKKNLNDTLMAHRDLEGIKRPYSLSI